MLNLYLFCSDVKNSQTELRKTVNHIISEIYSYLNIPSKQTEELFNGWKEDFKYIYGDISTNLSSNGKLKRVKVFSNYDIDDLTASDDDARLLQLFFSIQTCFSLMLKCITRSVLQELKEVDADDAQIIRGDFAKLYGIENYVNFDWFCWPLYELSNGFDHILSEIQECISKYNMFLSFEQFRKSNNFDCIKQFYEAIIPKEMRHALGEYYTPDWLAETTLSCSIHESKNTDIGSLRLLDPTCGSGTFVFNAITMKRERNVSVDEILSSVYGLDINPLAVLTAKTNYILAIVDLIDYRNIELPIYNVDVILLSVDNERLNDTKNDITPINIVKEYQEKDRKAVLSLSQFDIVVGNPPWVNWEYMPEQYKHKTQHMWLEYGLFSAKGRDLSFSKEDISVLITYIAIDRFLRKGGIIGFVIRQAVFKSAQNGTGFRKFILPDGQGIKVLRVDDLSRVKAFDNATNCTALFFAEKGTNNKYPVPYYLWNRKVGIKKRSFNAYSSQQEVMSQVEIIKQNAIPATDGDITSLWVTASEKDFGAITRALGSNEYRARTGVFTGGANAVYWMHITKAIDNTVFIENVVERAKRKTEQITAQIEKTYVYPLLKGSNVRRWNYQYDTYILCPHTAETKMWPVSQDEINASDPMTMQYLSRFRKELDDRNGFAGWEKEIQKQEFHAILRIGEYTFSKYKVIWRYIAPEFVCAVIGDADDPYLGMKTIVPNEKIMYVSTDDEEEAYYLCGILSSTMVAECVKSYMNPTSISAHVLNKLNIPTYDQNNIHHKAIARICKEGHGKKDIDGYVSAIDEHVALIL